ncbi:MAG TPA: MT-A70 family methyltransferase [Verrucomicrobiota bacterium]|nr:MT-A70 family methyltransferase [Verrucomicrobiota bacterium]HNU53175.1 MT-A70 family methyltransferase [Verrucomicrobiota bacterium]
MTTTTTLNPIPHHPSAGIFPLLGEPELAELADDIRAHGLRQPIVLCEGAVLDGRNRLKACELAGVEPRFQVYEGVEPTSYVISTNLKRRHLNASQRAAVAVEALPQLEREARERKRATLKKGDAKPDVELIPPREGKSRDQAGQKLEVSGKYVSEAKAIKERDPEAFEQVRSGERTITDVKRQWREQEREERRADSRQKAATAENPLSLGARFATLVLDPPWDWGDEGDQDQLGRARPTYATLSFEQLLRVPVPDLADVDSHLYLWITNRSLPKGFALLERWGFRYVTALTWPKPSFGMGNYFRGQTEHVLFGVRGSQPLKRKDAPTLLPTWQRGPNGHSSKPVEFYDFIESCSPGPYVELFARFRRPGWAFWGAEA